MTIERRFIPSAAGTMKIEKRQDGGNVISGYAAVFYDASDAGTEYMLFPGMVERVMPTAFDRCIRERQDVRGLFNHSPDNLLGRLSAGTMRLMIDRRGLRYEIDLPATRCGEDVAEMIRRGDLTGSSFSFMPVKQQFHYTNGPMSGVDVRTEDDIRELHDVDVMDVGPVSFPAYESTTTGIRAIGDVAELRCVCDAIIEPRGVVRFQAHDLIDDENWDADAALSRVKAWASEGDRMSMRKFARAFAWHDGSGTEAGHRALHHDVRGGKLMTHKGAVTACLRSLGGDGGGIPEDERKAAESHLTRHRSWDDPDMDGDNDDDNMMRMRLALAEIS